MRNGKRSLQSIHASQSATADRAGRRACQCDHAATGEQGGVDPTIVLFLVQDAVINGAIYALVAVALLLVFAVTRVILVPQGRVRRLHSVDARRVARRQGRRRPRCWSRSASSPFFRSHGARGRTSILARSAARRGNIALPIALALLARWLAPMKLRLTVEILLTLALVDADGADDLPSRLQTARRGERARAADRFLRRAFLADRPRPCFLRPRRRQRAGADREEFPDRRHDGDRPEPRRADRHVRAARRARLVLQGDAVRQALRACASNRLGARLVGVSTSMAGRIAFGVAALIGAVSASWSARSRPSTTIQAS